MTTTGHNAGPQAITRQAGSPVNGLSDAAGSPAPVSLSISRSFDSGEVTAAQWNSLVALCDAPVYSTWEWQSLWWKHLGCPVRGRVLNNLVFRAGGRIVGIAPFFAEPADYSGISTLRLIGSGNAFYLSGGIFGDDGPSDYLDIIADPEYTGPIVNEIAGYLHRNRRTIGGLELVNLRPEGIAASTLLPGIRNLGFRVETSPGDICPFIGIETDTGEFIRKQGSSLRRRLNQAFRLLEDGSTEFHENRHRAWNAFFGDLVDLHQGRWNRAGFPGLFHDANSRLFQKAAAEMFMNNGWLWFGSIHEKGRCVAARMGFAFRGRMYDYLSGFDESSALARRRPGMGLLLAMHRAAHASGLKILDMLRGDEKYKFELTSRSVRLVNARILHPASAGSGPNFLRRAAPAGRLVRFLVERERRLLQVQVRQYGYPGGMMKYIGFRVLRMKRKFSTSGDAHAD